MHSVHKVLALPWPLMTRSPTSEETSTAAAEELTEEVLAEIMSVLLLSEDLDAHLRVHASHSA